MLSEELFTRLLAVECKRTERSGRRFVLMLLDCGRHIKAGNKDQLLARLLYALARVVRDTDLKGWHKDRSVIGVIFTEIGATEEKSVVHALSTKVTDGLYGALTIEEINEIRLSFYVFPKDWDDEGRDGPATSTLQLALGQELERKKFERAVKRLMDIAGSAAGLIVCMPLFFAIAMAIKLTSRGPVLFRQVRLGQYGRRFTFLKFRSMHIDTDHSIHEEYIKSFIAGSPGAEQRAGSQQKLYKLTADPRVTAVGRFLRKTSLDELPQLIHVLRGEMSLIGPRPPLVYEFKRYHLWHKRRLLAVKPGITGLWQVDGRSRVSFDEMVRLDLRYASSWSLWLDIKILLRTPRAVLSGEGAC